MPKNKDRQKRGKKKGPSQDKPTNYYGMSRPEVRRLIPAEAVNILDVGCGSGALGAELKKERECRVTGVELVESVARKAEEKLDRVICGDVEEALGQAGGGFDAIVFADVLEHLRDPEELIKKSHKLLAPGGCVVASLPNVRHQSVLRDLIEGRWDYREAGILDRTHLRFFTRSSLIDFFVAGGYMIEALAQVTSDMGLWPEGLTRELLKRGIDASTLEEDGRVYQYLVRAVPRPETMVSIVMLTCGQLPYTKECVESIRKYTPEPHELVVVDNGSKDGTVEWLKAQPDIRAVFNKENRGFPAGCNQGMAVSRGTHMLLLNNDVVVTKGWLKHLLQPFEEDDKVGVVGPRCNFIRGAQKLEGLDYKNMEQMHEFAGRFHEKHKGERWETNMIVGLCMLFPRELYLKIGGLDERFGLGNFEDDDFSLRTRFAGYKPVVANDVFIHHYGTKTYSNIKIDYKALLKENMQKFIDKWPFISEHLANVDELSQEGGDKKSEKDKPAAAEVGSRPRVSLCMIAKNEEDCLAECLEAARDAADEIILVDTGSTDRTAKIAREYGARVYLKEWEDDFSAARNVSIYHASGDWILVLDADEVLGEGSADLIRQAVEDPEAVAYYLPITNLRKDKESFECLVLRLFRKTPGVRFQGAIHEQVHPSLTPYAIKHGLSYKDLTDIRILHKGYSEPVMEDKEKFERNERIFQKQLKDNPDDLYAWYKYAEHRRDRATDEEALELIAKVYDKLREAAPGKRNRLPFSAEICARYALELYKKKEHQAGLEVVNWAFKTGIKPTPNLHYLAAGLNLAAGNLEEAGRHFEACREFDGKALHVVPQPGVTSWLALRGLAEVRLRRGELDQAREYFETALSANPADRDSALGLCRVDFSGLDAQRGFARLTDWLKDHPKDEAFWFLGAEVFFQTGNFKRAGEWFLRSAIFGDPASERTFIAREYLGESLLYTGQIVEALETWAAINPPTLRSSLGVLFIHQLAGEDVEIEINATEEEAEGVLAEMAGRLAASGQEMLFDKFMENSANLTRSLPGLGEKLETIPRKHEQTAAV